MSSDNPLNYVDYDFDNLLTQLIQRLQSDSEVWKDTYRSATGQMILEAFCYIGNMLLYALERRAEESYIGLAQNRSSVINLVKILNYQVRRCTSSSGILEFSIPVSHSSNIFIPQWTECQTADGTKFLTTEDVVLFAGQTSVSVQAVQGELIDIEQTSSGSAGQEFILDATDIENSRLYVYVSGIMWTELSSFLTATASTQAYRVVTELNDTIKVIFGDGINGKIPPFRESILFRYVKSSGRSGNVYTTGLVTTVNSVIYDASGATVPVSVSNTSTFLGGSDIEGTEQIRYNAPLVFSTGDRAVTRNDFLIILKDYPGVASANVWGENDSSPPNYDMFNRVNLCVLLDDWVLPDATFKSALSAYLYTKSMITVKYEYVTPVIIDVIPVLSVYVDRGFSLAVIQAAVETVLEGRFALGDTTTLGTPHRLSDLTAAVDGVAGVSHLYLALEVHKVLDPDYDSTYNFSEALDALPVTRQSVKVYADGVQVAADDGLGAFTDISDTYTVSGAIDYATGFVGIDIDPIPTSVSVRYKQDSNGDVVPTFQQICRLHSVDTIAIAYTS